MHLIAEIRQPFNKREASSDDWIICFSSHHAKKSHDFLKRILSAEIGRLENENYLN